VPKVPGVLKVFIIMIFTLSFIFLTLAHFEL
jgi:hypothetical protein